MTAPRKNEYVAAVPHDPAPTKPRLSANRVSNTAIV
jgi:hypothetical protein